MSTILIRPCAEKDFGALLKILEVTGLRSSRVDLPEIYRQKLIWDPESILVADEKATQKIIGAVFLAFDPMIPYLFHLAVLPEYQGRGTGTLLIRSVEKIVRSRGVQHVYCSVLVNNPGRRLFEKCGWLFDKIDEVMGRKDL